MQYTMYTRFSEFLRKLGPEMTAERAKEMGFESVEMLSSTSPGQPAIIPDTKTANAAWH